MFLFYLLKYFLNIKSIIIDNSLMRLIIAIYTAFKVYINKSKETIDASYTNLSRTIQGPWGTNDPPTDRIAEPANRLLLAPPTSSIIPARAGGVFMQFCKNLNSRS